MRSGLVVSRADPTFAASVEELQRSTSRILILLLTGTYVAWYVIATEFMPGKLVVAYSAVIVLLAVACIVSLWLLTRSLLGAQAVWLAGFAVTITWTVYLSRQPAVAFLYALLPLMATIVVSWEAGLLAEGVVVALVVWLAQSPAMPDLAAVLALAIIGAGALTGIMAWAATRSLLTVTEWSLFSARQAESKVEEARDQRLELKQTQQDLILANRELARLSDRLEAMCQVAEEARRAKEEFVANVSHELRTPLNMIIGFSEMITELPQVYGAKLPSALLADIAAIQRNSQHLAKLVDDVLDLSQVEAGRMALSKEWASLQAIVDEAVLATQALFKSKGLYLEAEIPPNLPRVFCDGTRIRQVVLNLLSNAGRFTQHGGVRVTAQGEDDCILVSVADTGPGIAPEDQKGLFQPFRQLEGAAHHLGGSGLGLAISRQFVEMHGGKMWVESEVGRGTIFSFRLPLAPSALVGSDDVSRWFNPYQEYEARTRRSKAPVPVLVPRYVVMEKGNALQRLLGRYLDGSEIVGVGDSEGAMRELSRSPARALIVNTPDVRDVPPSLSQLSHLPYDTPAITCWVPGPDEAARRLGVVKYLVKPVPRELLLSSLALIPGPVETVLLVDDEPEVLQLFARMLSAGERSYRILQASDGQRALSLLSERRPDVMLLDLVMPGIDGIRILREKAQDPAIREIPVILVSSRDPGGDIVFSDTLMVTHASGLSARDLLACIGAVSEVLSPSARSGRRGQPAGPAG